MPGIRPLGPVVKWDGARTADLGTWLVVLKHNAPIRLFGTGQKLRRFSIFSENRAPSLGASVAVLNTSAHDLDVEVINVCSADGFVIPRVSVSLGIRVCPERDGAAEALISLLRTDGEKFFDRIEAAVRQSIEATVRAAVSQQRADRILAYGPHQVAFPDGVADVSLPAAVEITALHHVSWTEDEFSRQVRVARETNNAAILLDVLDEEAEEIRRRERDRAAAAAAHDAELKAAARIIQTRADIGVQRIVLETEIETARRLGVDPLAIVAPELWQRIRDQHADVATALMKSPQLYQVTRNSPELMRAIFGVLSGRGEDSPLARQAHMVLDTVDPVRVRELGTAKILAADASDVLRDHQAMISPIVDDAWRKAGATAALTGSALTVFTKEGITSAYALLMSHPIAVVPPAFESELGALLSSTDSQVVPAVYMIDGVSVSDAIDGVIAALEPGVVARALLREVGEDREVLVHLTGDPAKIEGLYSRLNNPLNPTLPTLEKLVGVNARVRLALPGV